MTTEHLINIPEFYAGKDIFITGGSGFIGKALIEKILRSCPKVNKIFTLIREKKDKTAKDRLEVLKNNSVFDRIKVENPTQLNKLIAIKGDVSLLGLGIPNDERVLLDNVGIIFHVAASVKFDDPLKDAVLMNTRGTREVMLLGEQLKNLKICMHVSTTYCNPTRHFVDEIIYPPVADWKKTIHLAETMDDGTLEILTPKYMNYAPNTYTFTKGLSEQVVNDFKHRLPVVIFRPSIVISSIDEPFPGWLDNFNGPVGLLAACGTGLMRTTYANPDTISDYTPVDIAIKAMITVSWKHGLQKENDLDVYNCSTANVRHITMGGLVEMARELAYEVPLDNIIWTPGGGITNWRQLNYIRVLLLHIFPAFILDLGLKWAGKKQFLVRLQRKIYTANLALEYFILNSWDFKNDRFQSLNDIILLEDRKSFAFEDLYRRDVRMYFLTAALGGRKFLLKQKDEDIPKAKIRFMQMYYLDKAIRYISSTAIIYFCLLNYGSYIGL